MVVAQPGVLEAAAVEGHRRKLTMAGAKHGLFDINSRASIGVAPAELWSE
jgi:hypothetical protein